MGSGPVCRCEESAKPLEDRAWRVTQYRCNHSAFNGNHYTPSDWSAIRCLHCRAVWRTKAGYAQDLFLRHKLPR